jgi:hypothetical protein
MDSHFRSISKPFEHQGVDEVMFARTDIVSGDEHYSKSTLYIDPLSRRSSLSGPTDIRDQSFLYGYDEEGVRHVDLLECRKTLDDPKQIEFVDEGIRRSWHIVEIIDGRLNARRGPYYASLATCPPLQNAPAAVLAKQIIQQCA